MKALKIFDTIFLSAVGAWVLYAWVVPAVFDEDSDIALILVYAIFIATFYFMTRFMVKKITGCDKPNNKGDSNEKDNGPTRPAA